MCFALSLALLLQGCATVSRNSAFKTSGEKTIVRQSDLELVDETEVSVSYRTLLGMFRHVDQVNGREFNPTDKSYTELGNQTLLGMPCARPLRLCFGEVLARHPEAAVFQVVRVEKQSHRLFLGTESELKALVRAYRFRTPQECTCGDSREYTLEDIMRMMDNGEDIAGTRISAVNMVNFDIDKSVIKPESYEYLNRVATVLKRTGTHVEVKGHTDNTGAEPHNVELSRERAKSVVEYLASHGVQRSQMTYSYYGSSQPIDTNDTEEGRLRNRRVEFEFSK